MNHKHFKMISDTAQHLNSLIVIILYDNGSPEVKITYTVCKVDLTKEVLLIVCNKILDFIRTHFIIISKKIIQRDV